MHHRCWLDEHCRDLATAKKASNSSSWGIKSTPRPFSALSSLSFLWADMSDRPRFLSALSPCHLNNVHLRDTNFRGLWSADRKEQSYGEKEMIEEDFFLPPLLSSVSVCKKKKQRQKLIISTRHEEWMQHLYCHLSWKIIFKTAHIFNLLNSHAARKSPACLQ